MEPFEKQYHEQQLTTFSKEYSAQIVYQTSPNLRINIFVHTKDQMKRKLKEAPQKNGGKIL